MYTSQTDQSIQLYGGLTGSVSVCLSVEFQFHFHSVNDDHFSINQSTKIYSPYSVLFVKNSITYRQYFTVY